MDMCGFTEIEADKLRKAVGKKDAALLASLRDKFISGAVASGEDERKVSSFWEELMLFAQYASLAPLYRNI
jgi:DNA polymerase-3 subunit alpha